MSAPPSDRRRSTAEWVTFGFSCCVLAIVVGATVWQLFGGDEPPSPIAAPGAVTERDGRYFVTIEVENRGDDTAADVQVSAELTVDGRTTSVDQLLEFLAGGESKSLTVVFDEDPSSGEFVVAVRGFREP